MTIRTPLRALMALVALCLALPGPALAAKDQMSIAPGGVKVAASGVAETPPISCKAKEPCRGTVTLLSDKAEQLGSSDFSLGPGANSRQSLTVAAPHNSLEGAGRGEVTVTYRVGSGDKADHSVSRKVGLDASALTAKKGGGIGGLFKDFQNWALLWLPLIFMGLILVVLGFTLKSMPLRTKPQEIKPSSSDAIGWDDVAGVDEAKDELKEVVDFLRDPKRFKKLGARVPRGILLHGPPGTGKTLLAKAAANEAGAKFFAQSAASFVEMFVGLGAARIRRLFREARKNAPAIVFIDELDAVGATRGKDISGEKDQTLNQLLVEMDGFEDAGDVVVIAASNLLEKLDPALLRPGRFDRQILVTPPDLNGRKRILEVHSQNKPLHEVDFDTVARQTSGLTGADLANICNEAAIFAGRQSRDVVLMQDFNDALERVVAGMQSRRVINEHEKKVVAYHEAGHALCSELLPSVDKVHKISIVPRGKALGYTLNLPQEDRYLKTKEQLLDYLVVLLGGRVAEHVVFGEITTGASDDLSKVHDIARSMVNDYGMGTQIANRKLPADDYSMSDATRRVLDDEQQEIADVAYRRALELVVKNRPLLEELARTLLENEVLERPDIERIVGGAEHGLARPRIAASERTDS